MINNQDCDLVDDITFNKDITLDKELIAKSIKNISLEIVDREMDKLIKNSSYIRRSYFYLNIWK